MGILATLGAATNAISLAGSKVSLLAATKALVTQKELDGKEVPEGIQGFLFDIPEIATVNHAAQITDHWVEDLTTVQDHIAIEPIKISLTGKVGELVYTKTRAQAYAETVLNTLGPLGVLSPDLSVEALRAISTAAQLKQSIESVLQQARTLTGLLTGTDVGLNKQQLAYKKFREFFENRMLLTVETPWRTYDNMVIESFEASQDDSTTTVSTFTVNFKQIRTISTTVGTGKLVGRVAQQKAPVVNKGQQQGESVATSWIRWGR